MQDRKLITITVVADDDTGIYGVGDMDYSMPYATKEWVAIPENREKLAGWLNELALACRRTEPPFDLPFTGGDGAAKLDEEES